MHSEERNVKNGLEKKVDNIQKQLDVVDGCFKAQMMGGSSTPMNNPDVVSMYMSEVTHVPTRRSLTPLPTTMNNAGRPLLGEEDLSTSKRIEPSPTTRNL